MMNIQESATGVNLYLLNNGVLTPPPITIQMRMIVDS